MPKEVGTTFRGDGWLLRWSQSYPHQGRAQRRRGERKKRKISSCMASWLRLDGTQIGGDGAMVAAFLITLPKVVERQLWVETRGLLGWQKNGKLIFPVTTDFTGSKFGTRTVPVNKRHSFGLSGIKWWRFMNGELELLRPPFPSNVSFVFVHEWISQV